MDKIHALIHALIQQIFIETLFCIRYCSRGLRYVRKQSKEGSCLFEACIIYAALMKENLKNSKHNKYVNTKVYWTVKLLWKKKKVEQRKEIVMGGVGRK